MLLQSVYWARRMARLPKTLLDELLIKTYIWHYSAVILDVLI